MAKARSQSWTLKRETGFNQVISMKDTSGEPESKPHPPHLTNPSSPRYAGTYTRQDGYTLRRTTDGLTLKALLRPPRNQTRAKTPFYLVDGSTGSYISSLWGYDFEYDGIRYRMDTTSANRVVITPTNRRRGGE